MPPSVSGYSPSHATTAVLHLTAVPSVRQSTCPGHAARSHTTPPSGATPGVSSKRNEQLIPSFQVASILLPTSANSGRSCMCACMSLAAHMMPSVTSPSRKRGHRKRGQARFPRRIAPCSDAPPHSLGNKGNGALRKGFEHLLIHGHQFGIHALSQRHELAVIGRAIAVTHQFKHLARMYFEFEPLQ